MIYLRTGVPGAGKSLNTIKEICENPATTQKQKFYNNIKAFLLDLDFCNSFQGFFYGIVWPEVQNDKKRFTYLRKIKEIHSQNRLAELVDFPWLSSRFALYTEESAINLFVSWCKRCYPKTNLVKLNEYLEHAEPVTIEGLKLLNYHWTKTDNVTDWFNLPHGSVSVFDECQDHFPPMANSAKRPEHYTRFQRHRHQGFDIHLVTQHFTFLDSHVQKTTNNHVHYYQLFGSQRVTRFEKDKQFNTDNPRERELCTKTQFNRDKSFYGVYWSADEHTAKLRIPPKMIFIAAAIFACALTITYLFSSLGEHTEPTLNTVQANEPKTITIQKPAPETKQVLYTEKVTHPLNKLCQSYEYAGNQVIRDGNIVKVEHMINCVTGNTEQKEDTTYSILDGEEQATSRQIQAPVITLLSDSYLKKLGYSIYLIDSTPILRYSDTEIVLNSF